MAGVSTKEIKTRIRSMESTMQITKAMEMVAASKLRRAQAQAIAARPYFEILFSTIHEIVDSNNDFSSAYLTKASGNKAAFVVIAGDRGLAGGYNSNVLKMAYAQMEGKEAVVVPVGRKTAEFFAARQIPMLTDQYALAQDVTLGDCFTVAKDLCRRYLAGQFQEIHLVYSNFVSVLEQTPSTLQLLPLLHSGGSKGQPKSQILYEPDSVSVFDTIVPEYLGGILYGALCESRASEQAARRTAMDAATQNAEEMIGDLRLRFNQARQAAITQEITEIVAGS